VVLLSGAHGGPVGPRRSGAGAGRPACLSLEFDYTAPLTPRGDDTSDAELKEKVQELIDSSINPAVAGHGGFVELVDVQDSRVYLQMGGGCQGCGAADITLKAGIERLIKEEIPEVSEVLDTTDHASGSNPYYTAGKG
jgi:Fe/S biogenesis protein NfuA